MQELTIIYYTDSCLPNDFAEKVRERLKLSARDIPIVSVSQKPLDFGKDICVGNIGRSFKNIYIQILIGLQIAETEYVALCEHDCLYSPSYFDYRPQEDVAYNHNHWVMHVRRDYFSHRKKGLALSQCIGKRKVLINNIIARINCPTTYTRHKRSFEPGKNEERLGLPIVIYEEYKSKEPVIDIIEHGGNAGGRSSVKGNIRYKLPYWGSFNEVLVKYSIPQNSIKDNMV